MPDPLSTINTRQTPQSAPADSRQVLNSAGGYTFKVEDTARLYRFLTLGTDGGTYYADERKITQQNAEIVLKWARDRTEDLVREVVTVSTAGRAPRVNPAIFALAAASALGDIKGRRAALDALSAVCRTGTHLFQFAGYAEQFRGWGHGMRRAVGNWYVDQPVDKLAYQVLKYRQREGWTHRDLLRLAHPKTNEPARKALFDYLSHRPNDRVPDLVTAFEYVQKATTVRQWVEAINGEIVGGSDLSWEMFPDAALNQPKVWEALLSQDSVPITALIRQLPRLTNLGLLDRNNDVLPVVIHQIMNAERLRRGRVHPINVLIAMRTYAQGHGERGRMTWTPSGPVIDALDDAFYRSFQTVQPTGKRTLLALDVSGSMSLYPISGLPIMPRETSAALALVIAATEPNHEIVGFTAGNGQRVGRYGGTALSPLPISPRQRLTDAVRSVSDLPFGRTDCALPMQWAAEHGYIYDTIQIFTDNETWFGDEHPHQALRRYRERVSPDARLAVVGMTATDFSIADPADPGSLDVAGFDSAVPTLLRNFGAGEL